MKLAFQVVSSHVEELGGERSTSLRSRRQNLVPGEASAASETRGSLPKKPEPTKWATDTEPRVVARESKLNIERAQKALDSTNLQS
jgi:hypothetical protein